MDQITDFSPEKLLNPRYLQSAFQTIVVLATSQTVAVEELARWPELVVTPHKAFDWAGQLGRVSELEFACRNAAIDVALAQELPEQFALFVNLEPSAMTANTALHWAQRTRGEFTLMTEITKDRCRSTSRIVTDDARAWRCRLGRGARPRRC